MTKTGRPRKDVIEYCLKSANGPSLSCRCSISPALDLIKSSLDACNYEEFRRSCFGRFLDVPKLEFKGSICHLMIAHTLNEARGSLWFKIRNQEVEFGPKEFYMCTGLKFGPPKSLSRYSDVHHRLLKNRKTIYVDDVVVALEESSKKNNGSTDTLKLALLYFLYAVLLGHETGRKLSVPAQYIHVIDDLKAFNSYPWGLVSYQYLLERIFGAFDSICTQMKDGKSMRYDLHGFSHAFLCWVYESFPGIGSMCTSTVDGRETVFPRILRRKCVSRKSWEELKAFFLDEGDNLRFEKMIPSGEEEAALESERPYLPAVLDSDSSSTSGDTNVGLEDSGKQNPVPGDVRREQRSHGLSGPTGELRTPDDGHDSTEASSCAVSRIPTATSASEQIAEEYADYLREARLTVEKILKRLCEYGELLKLESSVGEKDHHFARACVKAISDAEGNLLRHKPLHTHNPGVSHQPTVAVESLHLSSICPQTASNSMPATMCGSELFQHTNSTCVAGPCEKFEDIPLKQVLDSLQIGKHAGERPSPGAKRVLFGKCASHKADKRKRGLPRKIASEGVVEHASTFPPFAPVAVVDLTDAPSSDEDDGDGICGRLVRRRFSAAAINGV